MRCWQWNTLCKSDWYQRKRTQQSSIFIWKLPWRVSKCEGLGSSNRCRKQQEADCHGFRANRTLLVLPCNLDDLKRNQRCSGESICGKADEGSWGQQPDERWQEGSETDCKSGEGWQLRNAIPSGGAVCWTQAIIHVPRPTEWRQNPCHEQTAPGDENLFPGVQGCIWEVWWDILSGTVETGSIPWGSAWTWDWGNSKHLACGKAERPRLWQSKRNPAIRREERWNPWWGGSRQDGGKMVCGENYGVGCTNCGNRKKAAGEMPGNSMRWKHPWDIRNRWKHTFRNYRRDGRHLKIWWCEGNSEAEWIRAGCLQLRKA